MMKIMLSYSDISAAEKGPNIGNIIYGHKKFFPAKIHSSKCGSRSVLD